MRNNGRPAVRASTLPVELLSLFPGEVRMIVCPDCGIWRRLVRSLVKPHRLGDTDQRCPGSAQLIEMDIDEMDWLHELWAKEADAKTRRGTQVKRVAKPAPAPAVSQIHVPSRPMAASGRRAA